MSSCARNVPSVIDVVVIGDELYKNGGKSHKQYAKNGINKLPDRIYSILAKAKQPKAKV